MLFGTCKKNIRLNNCLACLILSSVLLSLPVVSKADFGGGGVTPDGRRPIILRDRLEVQFTPDVKSAKLSTSLNRVSFGIATLDKALENVDAFDARPMFVWQKDNKNADDQHSLSGFYELFISKKENINDAIEILRQNRYVRSVAPVYAMPVREVPDDAGYSHQWAMNKIDSPEAYEIEKGSDTVKVALIDTGVMYSHPDLIDNIWVNPGEDLDGDMVVFDPDDSNLVDNDGNFLDDLIGWDFFTGFGSELECIDQDCGTPDNNPMDYNGHGTHCAGIVAGVTNNSYGMAGVAGGWGGGNGPYRGPRIICLRVGASGRELEPPYSTGGWVNSANCAEAVAYAAEMGADVINCSWGMSDTPAMRNAIYDAIMNDAIICHAAGNENSTTGDFCDYWRPTWNNTEKVVVTVAWTDSDDTKNYWSNYGEWVDICAPGTSIYSTMVSGSNPTFAYLSGSSMAAPHVCGAAALIRSHVPDMPREDVVNLILNNADEMWSEPLWYNDSLLGSGRLNVYNCLDSLPIAAFQAGPTLVGEAPLTVNFIDQSPNSPVSWLWNFDEDSSSAEQHPDFTYYDYGLKTVVLTVEDQFGEATEVLKNLIMVTADTIKLDSAVISNDTDIVCPVYLDNKYLAKSITLPFTIRDSSGNIPSYITLDSVSTDGARTDYFESLADFSIPADKVYGYKLTSNTLGGSTYLSSDTGLILNLYLSISDAVTENKLLVIEDTSLAGNDLQVESIFYDYTPVFDPGQIFIMVCSRGDANGDNDINIFDISFLISYLYLDGPAPPDENCANVNAENGINIFDITYLINYLYLEGPPPPL